jgi:tetratricopeptide (TPR) repeat protein
MVAKKQTGKTVVKLSNKQLNEMLSQARDLQWAGQHAEAIEVCTHVLDAIGKGNSRTTHFQMDLLDRRAESNWALLNNDALQKDAELMMRIAKAVPSSPKGRKLAFRAQALIWKGRAEGAQDKNEIGVKSLRSALKIARQNKQKYFEAESLLWMGLAQTGESLVKSRIKSARQAADLFLTLGNQSRTGFALGVLAWALIHAGRTEEAQHTAQTALTICNQIGDGSGKGFALNALSGSQTDLTLSLKLGKQNLLALEIVKHHRGLASIYNNLGYRYSQLGLYPRALRFYQKCLDYRSSDPYPLSNIVNVEIELNALDMARQHVVELRSLERDQEITAFTEELSGRIALIEGKPIVATTQFKEAIRISHIVGLAKEIGELALLGQAYLQAGYFKAALQATVRAVRKHHELNFPVIDDHPSQNIWWRHSLALRANKKNKEADEALEMAYDFLLKGIAEMKDDGLRRNYLNKVRINREIVQAWAKKWQKSRGNSRVAPTMPHLEVESSLREPFERLAEITLELNALKTVSEIQTFLVEEATELSGGERVMLILEKDGELELAESLLPHPQPFSLGEKGARIPLSNG